MSPYPSIPLDETNEIASKAVSEMAHIFEEIASVTKLLEFCIKTNVRIWRRFL